MQKPERSKTERTNTMKRTLMAIGIAVLASMMFALHAEIWQFMHRTFGGTKSYQQWEERPNPEFERLQADVDKDFRDYEAGANINPFRRYINAPPKTIQVQKTYTYHWTPDWAANLYWFPIFVLDGDNHILWAALLGRLLS
jgi:hypothetical protein